MILPFHGTLFGDKVDKMYMRYGYYWLRTASSIYGDSADCITFDESKYDESGLRKEIVNGTRCAGFTIRSVFKEEQFKKR